MACQVVIKQRALKRNPQHRWHVGSRARARCSTRVAVCRQEWKGVEYGTSTSTQQGTNIAKLVKKKEKGDVLRCTLDWVLFSVPIPASGYSSLRYGDAYGCIHVPGSCLPSFPSFLPLTRAGCCRVGVIKQSIQLIN